MKINKILGRNIVLIVIISVAAFLRFYNLSTVPPHLTPDEASLGYNAYSILKTGRDEHGTLLPIIFKSFGDNKPGFYIYLTIPFVALFGLNEFSTRFVGALFGTIAVYALFKFSKLLFKDMDERLPYIAAFMLAVSPWHIYFSRGAWEVNVALTFTLIGAYFFLESLRGNWYLVVSSAFFALTLLTYQGAKLSTAIVVLLLVLTNSRAFIKVNRRFVAAAVIVGFVICIPIIMSLFNGQASRLNVFSVFSGPRSEKYLTDFLSEGAEQVGSPSYYLFHSEAFNFLRGIMGRWFNHFSARFLFFEGDWQNPRHSAPYAGMLNLFDIPLLLAGLVALIKLKTKETSGFVLLWLVLACLPAALSRDQVHAVRSLQMAIPVTLVTSLGVGYVLNKVTYKKLVLLGGLAVYLFGFIYYLDAYFIHMPKLNSKYWEYGYKQAVEAVLPIQSNYRKITFQQSYTQPYIYFLFYGKYDPAHFQSGGSTHFVESLFGDVGQVSALDNISFTGIDWHKVRGESGTLVIGDTERIPPEDSKESAEFHIVSEIPYLNGSLFALRLIEIK